MLQELINGIVAGDLNTNQILQQLTIYHEQNVVEINEAIDQIEALEGKNTLLQLEYNRVFGDLNVANARLEAIDKSMDAVEKNSEKIMNNASTQTAELIRLRAENKTSKANAKDVKALRANKAAMVKKSAERELRMTKLEKGNRSLKLEIDRLNSDMARLRMTGQKTIGKYHFTLFPTKIDATDAGVKSRQVGLVCFNTEGAMKIIRTNAEGEIIQPRSHNFKFDDEQTDFIKTICGMAHANGHQFTNEILKAVN